MAALVRPLAAGSVLQNVTEEVGHQKVAVQFIRRELREAVDDNLLDEEDMNLFGLSPMTDPLDLVCCNSCKKPVMARQYAAHAELCKSLTYGDGAIPEFDGFAVDKKPLRKERKKSIAPTNQFTSHKERKKAVSIGTASISGLESYLDEQIQITQLSNVEGNMHMNGVKANPCSMHCSEKVALYSSKPLKGTTSGFSSYTGTNNLQTTGADVAPYVPSPIATKVYYSQRSQHLRRAIYHMFYGESISEGGCELTYLGESHANPVSAQISTPCDIYREPVVNYKRDDHISHLAQIPDQTLSQSSELYLGRSEGFVPSMNISQLPVNNNTVGPHSMPNSCAFAGKTGNPLGTVK